MSEPATLVSYSADGPVARISLTRPTLNALPLEDMPEGISAFLEHRDPVWKNR